MVEKIFKINKALIYAALAALIIITGCNALDADFGAFVDKELKRLNNGNSENSLISFSVIWGGGEYFGSVSGDKIFVGLPSGADLTRTITPRLIHSGQDYFPKGEKSFYDSAEKLVPFSIVSKNGKTRVYYVSVAKDAIEGLIVASPPSKTVYLPGEALLPAGLKVLGVYPGGSTADITAATSKYLISMTAAPPVPGTYTVTVSSTVNPSASDTFTILTANSMLRVSK
jgi:hypothetical protein